MIKPALAFAQDLVSQYLLPGQAALDATCGNGHDTLFLARLAGPAGQVIGFDLQDAAIENTRQRLIQDGQADKVTLHCCDHRQIARLLTIPVKVAMFNLGYLPGGDKNLITRPESTLPALEATLNRLQAGGFLSVMAYPGHEGGEAEMTAVSDFFTSLPQDRYTVLNYRFLNRNQRPPELFGIEKRE